MGTATYEEGMFGSYRSPQAEQCGGYPFGHGLSYTSFSYGEVVQLPAVHCARVGRAWSGSSQLSVCVGLNVTNTGSRAGADVLQAYIEFPTVANMPKLMLKGFHK